MCTGETSLQCCSHWSDALSTAARCSRKDEPPPSVAHLNLRWWLDPSFSSSQRSENANLWDLNKRKVLRGVHTCTYTSLLSFLITYFWDKVLCIVLDQTPCSHRAFPVSALWSAGDKGRSHHAQLLQCLKLQSMLSFIKLIQRIRNQQKFSFVFFTIVYICSFYSKMSKLLLALEYVSL